MAADPSTDGLVISEYVEGSSNNKAIEIYNGTGAPVSLGGLEFRLYSNGRTLAQGPSSTYSFPSVDLADGDVFVVTNPQFDGGLTVGGDIDATSGAINFNGNDAFTIVRGTDVVDSFGEVGNDAGFASNVTLRRSDFTRDTEPTDAFNVADQYASFGSNDVSQLGLAPGDDGGGGDPDPTCLTPDEDLTLISEIQGAGADPDARFDSPLDGQTVTIRAVVTLADSDLNGYFVQEEPADHDADPTSSEGLFVFQSGGALPVEGDTVELTDQVTAFFGLTQFSFPDTEICDVDPVTIDPTPLILPLDRDGREALESMLVTNAQDLQVTGLFTAYRFGELGLALDGPLPQATSVFAPDDPAAADLEADNLVRELKVNDRNEAFGQFNPYPWELFDEDLSAGDTMPAGRLVGALGYAFGEFKVEPVDNEVGDPSDRIFFPETDDTVPRPAEPRLADGNDVAAFNVLNYFNTFGNSAVLRGATNQEDFDVQTAKIVDAINRLDAAIVGLVELENDYEDFYDGDPATVPSVVTLVEALNAAAGFDKWSYIQPPESILTSEGLGNGGLGTDAIAQGIIYQSAKTKPVLPATTFDIDALLTGDSENNRWPLAQAFDINNNRVTVVVNHFKSKGSSCADTAGPGFGLGDDAGSALTGNCDLTRQYAADRLVEWVETKGNPVFANRKILLVGDFNSYEEEAPIEILVDAGYVDMVQEQGDDAFTYKFSGRYGRLDYIFASSKIARKVTDAEVWQINSIAPTGYLYFNDPIDLLAHGSSDHDPVVISLR
ncbi:MAG: ExeM/NucH family extracellular endonuclease [Acidimicrobiales bacterium]